jgi:hypothetical protein
MNPYESRKLAKRIHEDRARRIESILVRLAANGDLGAPPPTYDIGVLSVHSKNYVWCDIHGEIHGAKPNFYQTDGDDLCQPDNWRAVFVESHDREEEF